ncbi:hypothetical protein [Chitinophaga polysaccharea]|uniref:hypothetical protein n=1 Tax=Chitinophaga polysaccharea TaxID=1293035 RepID=UPI0011574786|nr:hypothetical protein [Chitinophaga polysaccharea]
MKPSAILPGDVNHVEINGQTLRKGSVAAFLANVAIIEQSTDTHSEAYTAALKDMLELVPALEALSVFKHLSIRSENIRGLIIRAYPSMTGIL